MRHELVRKNIVFEGRVLKGRHEYICSFPGHNHFREWGRVSEVLKDTSVACTFVPGTNELFGKHLADPNDPERCLCQTQLYVLSYDGIVRFDYHYQHTMINHDY